MNTRYISMQYLNIYVLSVMLQSVKLGTIRYNWDKIGQCDTITTQRTFTHKDKLEKVKSNRTALDIKSRFVFTYEEALVYH